MDGPTHENRPALPGAHGKCCAACACVLPGGDVLRSEPYSELRRVRSAPIPGWPPDGNIYKNNVDNAACFMYAY